LVKRPGNYPDLNPIENLWVWMKKKLGDHNCTNLQHWKEAILKIWLERTEQCEFLQNLVIRMPTRVQEGIDREGEMTRY
jgi:hypothetical protein